VSAGRDFQRGADRTQKGTKQRHYGTTKVGGSAGKVVHISVKKDTPGPPITKPVEFAYAAYAARAKDEGYKPLPPIQWLKAGRKRKQKQH
jgi:hypothetical protein